METSQAAGRRGVLAAPESPLCPPIRSKDVWLPHLVPWIRSPWARRTIAIGRMFFPSSTARGKDTFLSVALGPSPHAPARNDRRPLVGGDAWAVMRTEFAGRFLSPLGAMLTSAAGIVFHQRWVAGVRHVRRCRHHAGPNGPTIGNRRTAAAHRRRARGHRTPASQAPVVRARPRRAAARPQHAVAGSRSVGRLGDVPRVGRGARRPASCAASARSPAAAT